MMMGFAVKFATMRDVHRHWSIRLSNTGFHDQKPVHLQAFVATPLNSKQQFFTTKYSMRVEMLA